MAWFRSWIGDGVMSVKDIIQAAAGVGGGGVEPPDVSWDLDYARYDAQGSFAWNIPNLTYSGILKSITGEEAVVSGVFFKPDGTKMYLIGYGGDEINEYNLSTPWQINTANFSQLYSIGSMDTSPQGFFFKPDGTKMYFVGVTNDAIFEFNLSIPWDISSLVFSTSISIASIETNPTGIFFKPDGSKCYVCGTFIDGVAEFDLSTAWDISTAVHLQSFSDAAQENQIQDVFFKNDGTQMYLIGFSGDDVNIYNLSVPWDVSSSTYVQSVSIAAQESTPRGIYIRDDGSYFYLAGSTGRNIYQYFMAGYSLTQLGLNSANVITFSTDGTKMYATNNQTSAETYQYTLTTPWDTSTAVYDSKAFSFNFVTQGLFWKPDGTRLFICTTNPDSIRVYNVPTPWQMNGLTGIGGYGITQDSNPYDVFFKDDGTRMYVVGMSNDKVYEYSLSTAWNPLGGSAVFVRDFSVAAQDLVPSGLFFKPDGTKMYITGTGSAFVNEYDLATPWDISTASYSKRFYVGAEEPAPNAFYFKPEGDEFYVVGSRRIVNSYSIGI